MANDREGNERGLFDDDASNSSTPETPDSETTTEGDKERVTGELPGSQPFTHP